MLTSAPISSQKLVLVPVISILVTVARIKTLPKMFDLEQELQHISYI